MLLTGILCGPYVLNILDPALLGISAELRKIALIIILIKAGLSLRFCDLKKIGRPSLLMSFLPASFEIVAVILPALPLLSLSFTESAVLGAVLGAVSPAVVVPKMVSLTEKNYGTDKNIPQMILAGASLDDVYVIVMFTSFLGMETGGSFSFIYLLSVPISVFSGVLIGVAFGAVLAALFSKIHIRDSIKVTILMAMAFLFTGAEEFITSKIIPFSGLIAVISMAVIIKNKKETVADRLSEKFSRLWLPAEILLFVLVGASVDVSYAAKSGIKVLILIFLALFIRSVGVFICTFRSGFSAKECLFCALAYLRNRSGGDRFRSAFNGSSLRSDSFERCSYRYPYHSSVRCCGNRFFL